VWWHEDWAMRGSWSIGSQSGIIPVRISKTGALGRRVPTIFQTRRGNGRASVDEWQRHSESMDLARVGGRSIPSNIYCRLSWKCGARGTGRDGGKRRAGGNSLSYVTTYSVGRHLFPSSLPWRSCMRFWFPGMKDRDMALWQLPYDWYECFDLLSWDLGSSITPFFFYLLHWHVVPLARNTSVSFLKGTCYLYAIKFSHKYPLTQR
jgi:hypothetical protein